MADMPPDDGDRRDPPDAAALQRLLDREAIRDCIYRYCRGIDRADEAALRSSYWPDAWDNHGAYAGPVDGFVAMARQVWASQARNVHTVGNILITFRSDRLAEVESYFLALQRGPGADGVIRQVLLAGRYCDLFERRGDQWRVARRMVAYDWVDDQVPPEGIEAERFGPRQPIGCLHPDDPVYAIGAGLGA